MEQLDRRIPNWALVAGGALVLLGGIALLLPPRREQVEGHAYPIPSPERRTVVEVLNGTRRQGLARVATRVLRERGIDVVFFGNADTVTDSTSVLVRRGGPGQGKEVSAALGIGRVSVEPDTLRRVDVTVILGEDYRPALEFHP